MPAHPARCPQPNDSHVDGQPCDVVDVMHNALQHHNTTAHTQQPVQRPPLPQPAHCALQLMYPQRAAATTTTGAPRVCAVL